MVVVFLLKIAIDKLLSSDNFIAMNKLKIKIEETIKFQRCINSALLSIIEQLDKACMTVSEVKIDGKKISIIAADGLDESYSCKHCAHNAKMNYVLRYAPDLNFSVLSDAGDCQAQ